MDDRTTNGYASALLEIARAEGEVDRLTDELYRAARALEADPRLRDALTDPNLVSSRKQGIIEDLLGTRASKVTTAAINLLVAAGQAKHLSEIVSTMAELAAEQRGAMLAEVRSATDLDDEQRARLESALSRLTGRPVQAKVVVDPTAIGGLVAKIGDRVFDGTVKSRLAGLREQWG